MSATAGSIATEAGRAKEELAPEIERPRPDTSACQLEWLRWRTTTGSSLLARLVITCLYVSITLEVSGKNLARAVYGHNLINPLPEGTGKDTRQENLIGNEQSVYAGKDFGKDIFGTCSSLFSESVPVSAAHTFFSRRVLRFPFLAADSNVRVALTRPKRS